MPPSLSLRLHHLAQWYAGSRSGWYRPGLQGAPKRVRQRLRRDIISSLCQVSPLNIFEARAAIPGAANR